MKIDEILQTAKILQLAQGISGSSTFAQLGNADLQFRRFIGLHGTQDDKD